MHVVLYRFWEIGNCQFDMHDHCLTTIDKHNYVVQYTFLDRCLNILHYNYKS